MGIFKANDIRGIYPFELNLETIYSIGYYLPIILKTDTILVGRDMRTSSDEIFDMLAKGITDQGADVADIGLCDTPAVYFATAYYGYEGSVMITASHNPPEYNGLKISRAEAIPMGPDTGLNLLKELITVKQQPSAKKGVVKKLDISRAYKNHVGKFINDLSGIKVVMDCGNGAAGVYIHEIFSDTALDYISLFDKPDGTFPNHGPNPLDKESWVSIGDHLKIEKADLGILFDGDADRAVFFDENGSFISPDIITALIGHYYFNHKTENTGDPMYYDIRSSRCVSEYIARLGGNASPCTTGHANIKQILRERNGAYAGELSGHYYFRGNYFCDSGFIAAAVVLHILKKINRPFSDIIAEINPYSFSGEINFKVKDQMTILNDISDFYPEGKVNKMDGVRIDFDSWWFILRPSGAEPLLRLVVEAENSTMMNEKIQELQNVISRI